MMPKPHWQVHPLQTPGCEQFLAIVPYFLLVPFQMFALGFKLFLQIQIAHKMSKTLPAKKLPKKKNTIDEYVIHKMSCVLLLIQ